MKYDYYITCGSNNHWLGSIGREYGLEGIILKFNLGPAESEELFKHPNPRRGTG